MTEFFGDTNMLNTLLNLFMSITIYATVVLILLFAIQYLIYKNRNARFNVLETIFNFNFYSMWAWVILLISILLIKGDWISTKITLAGITWTMAMIMASISIKDYVEKRNQLVIKKEKELQDVKNLNV